MDFALPSPANIKQNAFSFVEEVKEKLGSPKSETSSDQDDNPFRDKKQVEVEELEFGSDDGVNPYTN